jgi:hypothetical protein
MALIAIAGRRPVGIRNRGESADLRRGGRALVIERQDDSAAAVS